MTISHNNPTEKLPLLTSAATMPVPQPISAATARRRQGAGALLVDIRPQVARHQGSITGALLIDPAAIAEQITDRHREIVVCSVSSRRAIPAAEQLRGLGYDRVHYLAGGYGAWRR
ncbi:MAG TPA: rhodanese-like domain-containing protein [Mycobacterium sp.]|nr:rhodanese-like domain-containing protein [Mycobacterium sp.]